MNTCRLIGSVDIGGTKTMVALTNQDGGILRKETFATILSSCNETFDLCCGCLMRFLHEMQARVEDLLGVGINVPGMYDSENEILIKAPFASWEKIGVKQYFQKKLQYENIFVENDVKNCALGEKYFGHGSKYKSYVWITVSTGIGGAIVQNGQIIHGSHNLAGEIGHIKVEYANPRKCSCGEYGCLEAYASGTAITRAVRHRTGQSQAFRRAFEERGLPADAEGCADLAKRGIRDARSIYEQMGDYLARGIAAVINLLNPQVVILGGGVAKSMDLVLPIVSGRIGDYVVEGLAGTPIIPTALGYEAALLGTTALVLDKCKGV